ncbi:MAG: hypothetical protein DSY90_05435 [Deltaproteobacteria bacterium]|nr:MAG: hypothetical protein DSY90_05435 [Deltaproteobacteria bacterium]
MCSGAHFSDIFAEILSDKRRRQRAVPPGKTATVWLREYLEKIRGYDARRRPKLRRLFLLNTGDTMTPAGIRSNLRKYRIRAGIQKPVSPHTFRQQHLRYPHAQKRRPQPAPAGNARRRIL